MKRRLHLTEGNSDKFWYINVAEDQVTVRYGRSGTAGTTRTKQYESADKALHLRIGLRAGGLCGGAVGAGVVKDDALQRADERHLPLAAGPNQQLAKGRTSNE